MLLLSCILVVPLLLFFFSKWISGARRKGLPLPPRPKPRFLVGNLHDLPKGGEEWVKYRDIGRALGSDMVYLNIFGKSMMAINSLRVANDLLDKKGSIYSDRPRLPYLKELCGWNWSLILMDYGRYFQVHRRIVQQHFQQQVVTKNYEPVLEDDIKLFLSNLQKTPERFIAHLKNMAGGFILKTTYGYELQLDNDKYVLLVEEIRERSQGVPGGNLVDSLPILKHLPEWFPFAKFHQYARWSRETSDILRKGPFEMVKQQMAAGTAPSSMTATLLESDFSTDGFDREEIIMNCSGVVYSAGADTTVTTLTIFFLAIMTAPAVQVKAQLELDKVIGRDRLPSFADRKSLPYINAIVKEVMRWQPVTRLGVPHCTIKDDIYNGMYIPKGTVVFANIWAMLRDPELFEDPDSFIPERYMAEDTDKPAALDPAAAFFGFGRRICPGRYLADSSIWLTIASILHLFTISKMKDADGKDIEEEIKFTSGLVNVPTPFRCSITPRFRETAELLDPSGLDE